MYVHLTQNGALVLYDDRDIRPGEKFADADLLGIPYRVIVSAKTVAVNQVELKQRTSSETQMVDQNKISEILAA